MENPANNASMLSTSTDGAMFDSLFGFGVRLLLVVLVIAALAIRVALGVPARQLARLARVCGFPRVCLPQS